ncbi:MAG: GNAT family N-acetyltransferase [Lachnospiraceae bacterium]|nr:GNAT family N-acetyltransferase [Lachnospiraceae bacterium]
MLRKLKTKDAPLMLEWMHDKEVLKGLQPDIFINRTIDDCINFIENSASDYNNCHMAIIDDNDEYQGTVSLKMIDKKYNDCEFAIVLRKSAQGKGYAYNAVNEIMSIAFNVYNLTEVYWNVLRTNASAIKLYRKCGFNEMTYVSDRRLNRAPKNPNGAIKDVIFFHAVKQQ